MWDVPGHMIFTSPERSDVWNDSQNAVKLQNTNFTILWLDKRFLDERRRRPPLEDHESADELSLDKTTSSADEKEADEPDQVIRKMNCSNQIYLFY